MVAIYPPGTPLAVVLEYLKNAISLTRRQKFHGTEGIVKCRWRRQRLAILTRVLPGGIVHGYTVRVQRIESALTPVLGQRIGDFIGVQERAGQRVMRNRFVEQVLFAPVRQRRLWDVIVKATVAPVAVLSQPHSVQDMGIKSLFPCRGGRRCVPDRVLSDYRSIRREQQRCSQHHYLE